MVLAFSARPSRPRNAGDPPAAPGPLALPERCVRAANLHRTFLQGLRSIRTTDQASRRDHRRSRACPRRTSRPTLNAQARDAGQRRYGDPASQRSARLPALPQLIRVLGVDDWAWCKGQTFGTILVDLERRQVVDLLPTRSADSLGEWLAQHPEVTTVSRDRQGVYAEGARRGAPEAVQVADRFHLVLNLTQAVERELAVNRRQLRIAFPSAPELLSSPTEEVKSQTNQIRVRSSIVMQQMEVAQQRRQQKLELFRTIKQMRAAGMKVSQIASQLGLCRRRIDKWIQLDELSERNWMQPRPGMPESFRDYLRQRWEAGCRHGRTLFAEIRKLGYVGCYSGLAKFLSPWRQPKAETRRAVCTFPGAPQLEATTLTASRQLSPQVWPCNIWLANGDAAIIYCALWRPCVAFQQRRHVASGAGLLVWHLLLRWRYW